MTIREGGGDQREGGSDQRVFPSVRNRLRQKIPTNTEFITMVTGHEKLRSYLHGFGLTDNTICPCEEEKEQTADRLIFQCKKLRIRRNEMIQQTNKTLVAIGRRPMKHLSIIIYKFS